jgi:hypothetical protein
LRIGKFLYITFRTKFIKETKDLKSKINFGGNTLKDEDKLNAIGRLKEIANTLLNILIKHLPTHFFKTYKEKSLIFIVKNVINQKKDE